MPVRLLLNDEIWKKLEEVLNEIKSKVGRPPVISDRLFIEAVLYVARTGIPWRDLPDSFGNFSTIYNRLRRWKRNGIFRKLWELLETDEIPFAENLFIDSTCVRASRYAGLPALLKKQEDSASRPSVEVEVDFQRKYTSVA